MTQATPPPLYYGQRHLTSPFGLGVASIVLASAATLLQVLSAVAAYPAADAVENASGAVPLTAYDALTVALLPVMLAAYVVTCLWLQQARRNTTLIASEQAHSRSAVWVWLGWWVPIVAIWYPFQVVRDIQKVSLAGSDRARAGLGLWWTCWLVWTALSRVGSQLEGDAITSLPTVETLLAVVLIIGLWRWIAIVLVITGAQSDRAAGRVAA